MIITVVAAVDACDHPIANGIKNDKAMLKETLMENLSLSESGKRSILEIEFQTEPFSFILTFIYLSFFAIFAIPRLTRVATIIAM